MADEILKRDENHEPVIGLVTDDAAKEIRMGRIDDSTKGLKVMLVGGAGVGTVTSVSVTTANGISGTVATTTTTPAITLSLGVITPTSVNGLTLASQTIGFTIAGGGTSKTLTIPLDASVSGTNTGDNAANTSAIARTTNIQSVNETGIADGEIAVFNLTNKDIRTSDKTIVTSLGSDDTTVPTSKAVKDVTDSLVTKATYDANTILYATSDNTPVALTIGASTIVGRKSTGDIVALTATETRTILNVADGSTANTKASGAELDTGTDDVKFATAKAIKDAHNVPNVVPSTAGKVMTSDGTDWISAAPATASLTYKNGVTTYNANTASGAQTIAHGLGATPKKVRLSVTFMNANGFSDNSFGCYDGTTNSSVFGCTSGGGGVSGNDANNAVHLRDGATNGVQAGVVTVDGTNITITWTKTGTLGNANMYILWEVE